MLTAGPRAARAAAFVPLAAVTALIVVAAAALARPTPNESSISMSLRRDGWQDVLFRMTALPLQIDSGNGFELDFDAADVGVAMRSDRLEFALATQGVPARVERASVTVADTTCRFEAAAGAVIDDESYLSLRRVGTCAAPEGPRPGRLELNVTTQDPAALAIWALLPPVAPVRTPESLLVMASPSGPPLGHTWARGRYIVERPGRGPSQAALLTFLWNTPLPGAWFWTALAMLALVLVAGTALLTLTGTGLLRCIGGALAGAAMAGAYAVLSPPLHAPDETNYLQTFAILAERPDLDPQIESWSLRNHFERLRSRSDQRFRGADREQPSPERWTTPGEIIDDLGSVMEHRSPAVSHYWSLAGRFLGTWPAARTLLALRLLNAAAFGLAMGMACALVAVPAGRGLAAYPAILLSIPTLAFFAMHVSNHALLVCSSIVAAGVLTRVVLTAQITAAAGAALGFAAGLALITSRSAPPMAVVWLALIAVRVMPSGARPARSRADTVAFWGSTMAPVALLLLATTLPYLRQVEGYLSVLGLAAPLTPIRLSVAAIVLAAAGAAVELALAPALRAAMDRRPSLFRGAALLSGAALTVGLIAAIAAPRLMAIAPLRELSPGAPPTPAAYIAEMWRASLGVFGGYPPDFLLVGSLWGGFGWLDTLPPLWLITGLSALLGILLTWGLGRAVVTRQAARAAVVVALLTALAATLTIYAALTAIAGQSLHGRYLLAWYLALVALAAAVVVEAAGRRPWAIGAVWSVCAFVHAVCVWTMLDRYFGP